jgi:hypothetical protein
VLISAILYHELAPQTRWHNQNPEKACAMGKCRSLKMIPSRRWASVLIISTNYYGTKLTAQSQNQQRCKYHAMLDACHSSKPASAVTPFAINTHPSLHVILQKFIGKLEVGLSSIHPAQRPLLAYILLQ